MFGFANAQILQAQQKMNQRGGGQQLKMDGILGPKTFGAMEGIVNEGNGGSPQTDDQHHQQQQQIMQLLQSKMGGRNPSMMMGKGMPPMMGGSSGGKFGFGGMQNMLARLKQPMSGGAPRGGMNPYGYRPQPMPTK